MTLAETDRLAQFAPAEIDRADARLAAFTKKFGQPHRILAYHAAFPVALTPDMVYQLWNNFRQDMRGNLLRIPWVAVADLLLSDLCREVGDELYQMDAVVRELLLDELESHPAYGPGRVATLARFLDDYVAHALDLSDMAPPDERALAQAQAWTALAYRKPQDTAVAITKQLQQLDWNKDEDLLEIGRLSRLLQAMGKPLADAGHDGLLAYAAVAGPLAAGDWDEALTLGRQAGLGTAVSVAGQTLHLPIAFTESLQVEQAAQPTAVYQEIAEIGTGPSVRLGFNYPDGQPCDLHTPLAPNTEYRFWLVAGPDDGRAEVSFSSSTASTYLEVVVFPLEKGLSFIREEEGMALNPDPALMMQKAVPFSPELVGERVTFEFITPDEPGTYHFRCHLLYEKTILQSRLVQINVAAPPEPQAEPQITAVLDYVLQRRWTQETLNRLGSTQFNLLISGEGSYSLFGDGVKGVAAISEGEWRQLTLLLRQALRRAAWGDDESYRPGKSYRYNHRPDVDQMGQDLVRLAVAGYRVFDALFSRSSPTDPYAAEKIIDGLQAPAVIQTAVTDSSAALPPLALLYDYPLDTGLPRDKFSLCPEFESAWRRGNPLHDCACFQGNCPSRGRTRVVCPSGFWGFRHVIAGPLSVGDGADAPAGIGVQQQPRLALHLSTHPNLRLRDEHVAQLQGMMKGADGRVKTAVTRAESLDLLAQNDAQVVYFYCRAGAREDRPWLQVGPRDEKGMTRGNLVRARVRWSRPRPLVFLNAVNSTSLTPENGRDLLDGFVQIAQAAGLVAADITLLEPLAARFADEFLRLFLVEQHTAGEALRRARLGLLQEGDPLGLAYTLYALPGLRLEPDTLADFGETAVPEPSPDEQIYQRVEPEPAAPHPDGRFLADVTMPDDVRLNLGAAFTKMWRVENSGNVPWGEGFQLAHTGGDLLAAAPAQPLPFTPPGQTAEISLSMTAPREAAIFYSDWRFQDDHGNLFGDTIFVRAIVEDLSYPPPSDGRFLADVTMSDDAEVQPGYRFTKTWQVRNTGKRVWGPDFKLKFVGGLPMTDVLEHPLPLTAPGEETALSVPMTAPTTGGMHYGDWRLVDERERPFGEVLYVRIVVPGRAAESEAVDDVAYRAPSGSTVRPISQRDPRWADLPLGYSGSTMSQRGSLLACYAMLARTLGHSVTPPELNERFMQHSAFLEGSVLRLEALADVFDDVVFVGQIEAQRDLTARVDASLQAGRPVAALVDFTRNTPYTEADEHFVLIVAKDGRDYRINDPWLWPAQEASLQERYGWAERPLNETIRRAIFYRKGDPSRPERKTAA